MHLVVTIFLRESNKSITREILTYFNIINKLSFVYNGSLGTTDQASASGVVIVVSTCVSVEIEHARVRAIVVVAAAFEPRIAGIDEVRVFTTYSLYKH